MANAAPVDPFASAYRAYWLDAHRTRDGQWRASDRCRPVSLRARSSPHTVGSVAAHLPRPRAGTPSHGGCSGERRCGSCHERVHRPRRAAGCRGGARSGSGEPQPVPRLRRPAPHHRPAAYLRATVVTKTATTTAVRVTATGTSSAERLDQPTQDSLQPACRGCLPGGAGVVPGFQVREWVDREAAGCLPTSDPHLEMQVGSGRVARLSRLA